MDTELFFAKDLSLLEKNLFSFIKVLDGPKHCTASNKYFSEFFDKSEKTISRAIAKLLELDLIEIKTFNGRNRVIKTKSQNISLLEKRKEFYEDDDEEPEEEQLMNKQSGQKCPNTPSKMSRQPPQKCLGSPPKNVYHNIRDNIRDNNKREVVVGFQETQQTTSFHSDNSEDKYKLYMFNKVNIILYNNPNISSCIYYWNNKTFLVEVKKPDNYLSITKRYYNTIYYLEKFFNGKLFKDNNYKFSIEDFQEAVDNFYLAVTSNDHLPNNKDPIRNISLDEFLLNPFNSSIQSYFLNYLGNPPQKKFTKILQIEDNESFEALKKETVNFFRNGNSELLTPKDIKRIIIGSNKLSSLWNVLTTMNNPILISKKDLAKYVLESLEGAFNGNANISNIDSDYTYNQLILDYLAKKGVMKSCDRRNKGMWWVE